MSDHLTRVLSAHVAAEEYRGIETAHEYGALLMKGTHSEGAQRRCRIHALTRSLIDHDRVLTGRARLAIGV